MGNQLLSSEQFLSATHHLTSAYLSSPKAHHSHPHAHHLSSSFTSLSVLLANTSLMLCLWMYCSLYLECPALIQITPSCPWRCSSDNYSELSMVPSPGLIIILLQDDGGARIPIAVCENAGLWIVLCTVCRTVPGSLTSCPPAHLSCVPQ